MLLGLGFTEEDLAKYWKVSHDTMLRWKKRMPQFCVAIEKGRTDATVSVTKSLYNKAQEGNLTAIIFWLTNRRPDLWSDRRAVVNNTIVNKVGVDGKRNGFDPELQRRITEDLSRVLEK